MRRVIRIKAMQALYSFQQNRTVNLDESYRQSLASLIEFPEFYNASQEEKAGFRELLPILLDEAFEGKCTDDALLDQQKWMSTIANEAVASWHRENEDQKKRILENTYRDITRQREKEVFFWKLFLSLIEQVEREEENRQNAHLPSSPSELHLLKITSHPFLPILKQGLQPEGKPEAKSFRSLDPDWIIRLYPVLFRELPEYLEYKALRDSTPEANEAIWKVLYRKLFRSAVFNEIMEEIDLHWSENRILMEVALKEQFQQMASGIVPVFSGNEDEEAEMMQYFKMLFDSSLLNEDQDTKMLKTVISNWDPERISTIDRIIIVLIINEIKSFPHIPVKVSINEFLEIAKAYSSTESVSFINGVADRVVKIFQKEGTIKKSARGMMDNR
jgi:N utilization substance protein B